MSNKDNMDLEVVITKKEGVFIATTPSFPKCKGTAKTKKEALSKLSQAIGRFIGRAVHKQIVLGTNSRNSWCYFSSILDVK